MKAKDLIERDSVYGHLNVAVFVDMQNLYYGARNTLKKKIDFKRLLEIAVRGRKLHRAIAYLVDLDNVNQGSFLYVLKSLGYEIKLKQPKKFYSWDKIEYKADWDMGIAIDAIAMAESGKIDVAVLMSGDGDFVDLVNFLKAKGIKVEVLSFKQITAKELITAADEYIDLYEVSDFIVFKEENGHGGEDISPGAFDG
ncbi:NYN domain-containing protein [Desulfurobacterium indicum]|uniref:RtsE n=1 Tax=Desulfurobacterium indicum TaxID=1914305 RepID=A0A1R1MLH2_9BACT|nr:NYN domain-containing protein [Desulfurobacterium indicum]OMH40570.1 RtsE [Desulfurobacterium indicum]